MTSRKDDGGPAFPVGSGDMRDPTGLTIRDWFAGKALQGLMASSCTIDIDGDYLFEKRAKMLYMIADAMLKARQQ